MTEAESTTTADVARRPGTTSTPFFSVVIPTRNRPEYLIDAVLSILEQTFPDFELIVSDNSDEANARENRRRLEALPPDSRLRYIRPDGDLDMVAHWEWALGHVHGKYYGMVADRRALRLYALAMLHDVLRTTPATAVAYGGDNATELSGYRSVKVATQRRPPVNVIHSTDVIGAFARAQLRRDNPRMLNSFVRSDVYAAIKKRHGTAFTGISPDYAFMFRLLDEVDDYIWFPAKLCVIQGSARSNGTAFKNAKLNSDSRHFLHKIQTEQKQWLEYGPIPGDLYVISNVVLREYEIVASQSTSGKFPPVDLRAFYVNAAREAARLRTKGNLGEDYIVTLESFRAAHRFEPVPVDAASSLVSRIRSLHHGVQDRLRAFPLARSVASPKLRTMTNRLLLSLHVGNRVTGADLIGALRQDAKESH